MTSWDIVLLEPARQVLAQMGKFLVNILLVVLILLIGWLISKTIRSIVEKSLKAIKLDDLSAKIELANMLEKGGIKYTLSELIAVIIYWVGILITFMVSINAVGLTIAADLLNQIVLYVPNVIAAIFILILGMFVATLLRNLVEVTANNAGISQSKILSKIVGVVIITFSIFVAMEQLKIGIRITELTLAIILGSVGLGFALAVGLGCKDIVAKYVGEFFEKSKSK